MRDKIVTNVVKKWLYKYHFSSENVRPYQVNMISLQEHYK